jgi:CRP-like cAMP-binding protein
VQYEFPVFEHLCPSWGRVTHLGTRQVYPKGALILDMDVPAKGVYFVHDGFVDTALYTLHGPEKVLYGIGQGCLFGEASCFSTGMTGEATVWARTACTVYFFKKETVEGPIAKEHPELLVEMVGLLGHIVRMYGVWLQDSLSQEYFERVCRILIYFVRWKLGENVQPGRAVLIHDELSQNDIAKLLGIHRVSVTKAVSRLKELGILRRFTKTELDIADYHQLCRLGLIHLSGQDTKLPSLPGFSEVLFRHASPTLKGGHS